MGNTKTFTLIVAFYLTNVGSQRHYNIVNYTSGPGLYYEKIGESSIYIKDFNVITYYDVQQYYQSRDNVTFYVGKVEDLCKKRPIEPCSNLVLLKKTLSSLDYKHQLIIDIIGIQHQQPTRRKRFWGELALSVVNGIFGVITNGQRQRSVSQEVQMYRQEVDHLNSMLTHQMYLYQNLQTDVNKRFSKLSNDIDELTKNVSALIVFANTQRYVNEYNALIQYTTNLIHLFTAEQSDLLDCLILARQGILHPMIVSPGILERMLNEAAGRVENNQVLKVALQNAADYSNAMFNMITPIIYQADQTLIFDFDIPLITDSVYDMYKLTSAPVHISNNIYAYVYPEYPYLFVDKKSERHFFLDSSELDKCKIVTEKHYACKRVKPLRVKKLTCEHMLLLNNLEMPETCDIRLIKIDETLLIELEREGSWLFVAPKKENLYVYCEQQLSRTNIIGTGVINVDGICPNTETDSIILRDFSTNNLNLTRDFKVLKLNGNLKSYVENVDTTYLSATMNIDVLSRSETVKLKDIGTPLSLVKMHKQLYGNASATAHNVLFYILCIVCCGILGMVIYMYTLIKKSNKKVDIKE